MSSGFGKDADTEHWNKCKEDLVHKQKPYDVSDTRGGVFGRMGEKRGSERGDTKFQGANGVPMIRWI